MGFLYIWFLWQCNHPPTPREWIIKSPVSVFDHGRVCIMFKPYLKQFIFFSFFFSFLFFYFLKLYPWHMEVPRLGVESELQMLAYITATAMWNLSQVCNPHWNWGQLWIHNPLSEARDGTGILMDTSWVRFCWATWELPLDLISVHCKTIHHILFQQWLTALI